MIYFGIPTDEFTGFSIRPLAEIEDGVVQECDPDLAQFWSVYTMLMDNTLQCIADVPTKEEAEKLVKFMEKIIELKVN